MRARIHRKNHMPEEHRFLARLTNLDHEAVLAYAVELSAAHTHTADILLAKHKALPDWARDDVLLSTDLLPQIFASSLQLEHGVAACVCHAWKEAWAATREGRRGLRPIRLGKPDFPLDDNLRFAELPSGNALICKVSGGHSRIVNSKMKTLGFIASVNSMSAVASDAGLFVEHCETLRRYTFDKLTELFITKPNCTHEHLVDELFGFDSLVLAPGNLLFSVCFEHSDAQDEVVCFDASTLEVRKRFGRGHFTDGARGMAVVGSELFITNVGAHRIDVFSFSGEFLRSIRGDFRAPTVVQHVNGRLYVIERRGDTADLDEDDGLSEEQKTAFRKVLGRRIFVTTLAGETLQEWTLPSQGRYIVHIHVYGRKLLLQVKEDPILQSSEPYELVALQGI